VRGDIDVEKEAETGDCRLQIADCRAHRKGRGTLNARGYFRNIKKTLRGLLRRRKKVTITNNIAKYFGLDSGGQAFGLKLFF